VVVGDWQLVAECWQLALGVCGKHFALAAAPFPLGKVMKRMKRGKSKSKQKEFRVFSGWIQFAFCFVCELKMAIIFDWTLKYFGFSFIET